MRIHFVTGKLAQRSLRDLLEQLAPRAGFEFTVDVLPITVAALMTPPWIARQVQIPADADRVLLPGYCHGSLQPIQKLTEARVELGPVDLRRLPEFFARSAEGPTYGEYDIEIIAEINHGPRLELNEIVERAAALRRDGADVIDVGCDPGEMWSGVGACVAALRSEGHRVSVDSLNPREIELAARAGAELVLSVNHSNRDAAADWGCEVVAIPDDPRTMAGLPETVAVLEHRGVAHRIDPVLEPIGFGFAASLQRYHKCRNQFADSEMMMGIGNLTELTDVDSAGINVVLLGICQELGIRSVLTTQVINWARSSVRECDLARRLVHHSICNEMLPKHVEPRLIMLRDEDVIDYSAEEIGQLALEIKDNNFRLFVAGGEIHLVTAGRHWRGTDPFAVFSEMMQSKPGNVDASHAFYLGFEMAKALTALTLGKQYQQDEALDWGHLTRAEDHYRLPRRGKSNGDDTAAI